MQSLKQFDDELTFVKECSALFDVIQQTALAQFQRTAQTHAALQPLTGRLAQEMFSLLPLSALETVVPHGQTGHGSLMILITSDHGLVGPLHQETARAAIAHASEPSRWMVVGARGIRLLAERGIAVQTVAVPPDEAVTEVMGRLAQEILQAVRREPCREMWLVFPRYESMTVQTVTAQQLLPPPVTAGPLVEDLVIEPSTERVVDRLMHLWVWMWLVEAFWSSRLAELAARSLHLESAREELGTRLQQAHRKRFKAMHERVDVMVREIYAGKRWR